MDIQDRSVLLKAASGDNKAIRRIWELWSPRLMTYLSTMPGLTQEDREDLTQEILWKIYRSLQRYNPVYAPATWIYTIAARTAADWKRQQKNRPVFLRGKGMEQPSADPVLQVPDRAPSPETAYLYREENDLIRDFILRQSPRDQRILFLTGYEGLSGRKAARIIGMPPDTLRYRLKILREKLKEEMP